MVLAGPPGPAKTDALVTVSLMVLALTADRIRVVSQGELAVGCR